MTTLIELYNELYGPDVTMVNLERLGIKLGMAIGREMPFSARYLRSIIKQDKGFESAPKPVQQAVDIVAAIEDGQHPLATRGREVVVLAIGQVREASLILGDSVQCAYPPCKVWFVPRSWNGSYCCPEHYREARKLRRRNGKSMSGLRE